jgi:hypothetical protein
MAFMIKPTKADRRKFEQLVDQVHDKEEANRLFVRWKAQNDTFFLATEVLNLFNSPQGKKRLDPRLHRRMCAELDRGEDTLQLYPRDHMKTSWVRVWCVREILKNPNIRIAYFSRTAGLARQGLAKMKQYLLNEALLFFFPELRVKSWDVDTQDAFTVKRFSELGYVPPEPMVEGWGVEGTVVGKHHDRYVFDDIIDHTSTRTAAQIEKTASFWSMIQPVMDPDSVIKMIGTHYHYQDIYATVREQGVFKQRNIVVEQVEHNGKFLYKFYNKKKLERKRRSMTPYDFSCQYYNDPRPQEDRFFVPPYPIYMPQQFPEQAKHYISVDPAATVSQHSDSTGICVAAVNKKDTSRAFFVEAKKYKEWPDEIAEIVVSKIAQYQPYRVGIELGLQQALQSLINVKLKEVQQQNPKLVTPEFVAIPPGKKEKADKINRTIAAFIRDGRALLRADSEGRVHAEVDELRKQMDFYNPNSEKNEDDVLDAAAMMIQTVEHFAQAHWFGYKEEPPPMFSFDWLRKYKNRKSDKNRWDYKFVG